MLQQNYSNYHDVDPNTVLLQDLSRVWQRKNDYDYSKAGMSPDLQQTGVTALNAGDAQLHYSDVGKLPQHPTFSQGSFYANQYPNLAGQWHPGVRQDESDSWYAPHPLAALAQLGTGWPRKQPVMDNMQQIYARLAGQQIGAQPYGR